jgi:integrase
MILLPNNCYRTELKVNPRNWQTVKASIKKDWFIYYRSYTSKESNSKQGKLIILKGMNHLKIWEDRISETVKIMALEKDKLEQRKNIYIKEEIISNTLNLYEIPPTTNFIQALELAEKRINAAPSTKRDLKSTIKYISNAAESLNYKDLPINLISRKHFKHLLFYIDSTKGESIHRYNKIRSYLMMIYKELVELETVDYNPLKDISKKKGVQRLKRLPSLENRQSINAYLKLHHYRFWLFTNIFFHSGARLTELMNLKKKDVDLKNQAFIVTIKKGNIYKEVLKPIKNIALEFWKESIATAEEEDYIFSKGLLPGSNPIQSYQITKRWNLHIKKKLGIQVDFYSLKHLNLDQTAAILNIQDASAMASHTSTFITSKHYAINEYQRQNERLKSIKNSFTD